MSDFTLKVYNLPTDKELNPQVPTGDKKKQDKDDYLDSNIVSKDDLKKSDIDCGHHYQSVNVIESSNQQHKKTNRHKDSFTLTQG